MNYNQILKERDLWDNPEQDGLATYENIPRRRGKGFSKSRKGKLWDDGRDWRLSVH
jgi:hypothetical protein